MEERLKTAQENILKKLSRIELEYFRNWLMNHYDIFALGHNITSYIDIIDEMDIKHKDIINFLKTIKDHTKWEIDESDFINEEKSGCYKILDVQELMEDLSKNEYERFIKKLAESFPIYQDMDDLDYFDLNDSFGEKNFPTWDEAFEIIQNIKAAEMTIEDLLSDTYEIDNSIVLKYEKTFGRQLPVEVQKIISHKKDYLVYNGKKNLLMSPEKWIDWLDFHGFNLKKSGLIPLLYFDCALVVCYDPKEEEYLFKELGLGFESDGYKSLVQLLNDYDSIFKDEEE